MKRKFFFALAGFILSTSAYAGEFYSCNALEIITSGDQNVHVRLSCNMTSPPPCATALPYFGFDATTIEGKRYFSLISMALALNLKLTGRLSESMCAPQGNVALLISLQVTE